MLIPKASRCDDIHSAPCIEMINNCQSDRQSKSFQPLFCNTVIGLLSTEALTVYTPCSFIFYTEIKSNVSPLLYVHRQRWTPEKECCNVSVLSAVSISMQSVPMNTDPSARQSNR